MLRAVLCCFWEQDGISMRPLVIGLVLWQLATLPLSQMCRHLTLRRM